MKKTILTGLITIGFFIFAAGLPAGLYIWVDENGVKHFSDTPPEQDIRQNNESDFQELAKTQYYNYPVYIVTKAPDPDLKGTYVPIDPTKYGFPQYEKQVDGSDKTKKPARLAAVDSRGYWLWRLRSGKSTYFSQRVWEGTAPADNLYWAKARAPYEEVDIKIKEEIIVATVQKYEYSYVYDPPEDPELVKPWQKKAYRVSGLHERKLNGDYYPVSWASPWPRYKKGDDICLIAKVFAGEWEWNLGECEHFSHTAELEAAGTMPDKVQKWYQRGGRLYVPVGISEIE